MFNLKVLEIPLRHGSDYVCCYDATGYSAQDHRPVVRNGWQLILHQAPRDLRMLSVGHKLKLFRNTPDTLPAITTYDKTDYTRSVVETYTLAGSIESTNRHFNPRRFVINAGQGDGHWLALYRSPLGTVIPSAGALMGTLMIDEGNDQPVKPAAWALVSAVVTPTVGDAMQFTAQADAHGDFILPLNRIPPLTADAPSSTYSVVYTAKIASQNNETLDNASGTNPEQMIEADIESFNNAGDFLPTIEFNVMPGITMQIKSKNKPFIVLRQR